MFRRGRFLSWLRDTATGEEYDPNHLDYLASKFREGIAKAIGVPPEWINEEKVRKWVENYVKAFVKPEYWNQVFSSPGEYEMELLGYELGELIKDSFKKKVDELPSAIKHYVKSISRVTGNPEWIVLLSKPVKEYMRKYGYID